MSGEIRGENPSAGWVFSPQRSSLKGWGSGPTPNSANTPVLGDAQFDVFPFRMLMIDAAVDLIFPFWK